MKKNKSKLEKTAIEIRKTIIEMSYYGNKGHISSALSVVDILTALYWEKLNINNKNLNSPYRDRFILSKGHAANALYATLYHKEILSDNDLKTYGKNDSLLGVHPENNIKGVEFSTGSLGHGLSVASGIALGEKKINSYVLLSDAECQEGSVWESALFASQHKLSNLSVFIDYNKTQAFGKTNEVTNLEPLSRKWNAFGWETYLLNGNNINEICKFLNLKKTGIKPVVYICKTISGKGVSFMESQIDWHYINLDENTYKLAMSELSKL